jgi:hypothetical protein
VKLALTRDHKETVMAHNLSLIVRSIAADLGIRPRVLAAANR